MERLQATILAALALILLFACAALGVATYVPDHVRARAFHGIFNTFYLTTSTAIIAAGLVITLSLLAGCVLLLWIAYSRGWIWHSSARLASAQALRAERDAHVQIHVAAPGSQVYEVTLGHSVAGKPIYARPLHLAPGQANGQLEYSADEAQRWAFFQLTQSISRKPDSALALPEPEAAALPSYVSLEHYVQAPSLRSMFLGVGRLPDGQVKPIQAPLDALVHIGTGGAPGFGKSTFMQALAWQILNARETPRPVLLDPQAVTFSVFAGDGRLLYPLASKPADITAILAALVEEMERRQSLFSEWRGVQTLNQYNEAVSLEERLSPIPVLFDEFGFARDDKHIPLFAKKLSQGGRKAGISLIVGTQHWGHTEISTAFRGDLSTRVQFYTQDKSDSRILLGDSSAVNATRPGQAFAALPGMAGIIELQAPDPSAFTKVPPEKIGPAPVIELSPRIDRLDGDDSEAQANEDAYFVELVGQGKSRNEASRLAYGRDYAGNLVTRGKRALGEIE